MENLVLFGVFVAALFPIIIFLSYLFSTRCSECRRFYAFGPRKIFQEDERNWNVCKYCGHEPR